MPLRTPCVPRALVLSGLLLASLVTAQPAATEPLAALELRLRADPDNLQLGAAYRQQVIRLSAYDRGIAFFEKLVEDHPAMAYAQLNLGYAYVDRVPEAGFFSRPLLANGSLDAFSRSIAIRPTWLALFSRGNGYLYWPKVFGKADDAVADLREAIKLQEQPPRPYHARAHVALGDGYHKLGDLERARRVWAAGAKLFPDDDALASRLAARGDALEEQIDQTYVIGRRLDTSLREMTATPPP